MAINIGDQQFEGAYDSAHHLKDASGVYAILDYFNQKYYILDIGESHFVKTRVLNHERSESWENQKDGKILYAVLYTPHLQQPGRKEIEQELREKYNPPCGER